MDIYSEIKTDHKAAKSILDDLNTKADLSPDIKRELFSKLKNELRVHNKAEEVTFYSKLTSNRKERILTLEGKDEHRLVEQLLKEIDPMDNNSDAWAAKIKVLQDLVKHHVEEEEGEIHKEAKKHFTNLEAIRIGEDFVALKKELNAQLPSMVA